MLISRTRSDTWDDGNYLTRFYEYHFKCDTCDGKGEIEDYDGSIIECPECEGIGEWYETRDF